MNTNNNVETTNSEQYDVVAEKIGGRWGAWDLRPRGRTGHSLAAGKFPTNIGPLGRKDLVRVVSDLSGFNLDYAGDLETNPAGTTWWIGVNIR